MHTTKRMNKKTLSKHHNFGPVRGYIVAEKLKLRKGEFRTSLESTYQIQSASIAQFEGEEDYACHKLEK